MHGQGVCTDEREVEENSGETEGVPSLCVCDLPKRSHSADVYVNMLS